MINPRILKGFKDYLPRMMLPRVRMIQELQAVFAIFGFAPIDTPAIEYAEILLGKGSEETDKQLYRFLDNGERDVALRFDLTVPLARFAAMYINELGTPFRRYHIAPVWRAEKPQKGRYREFVQCDFDIIGSKSVLADAEIICLVNTALDKLGAKHLIRINNRLLLNGLLDSINALDSSSAVLRAIDKLEKLGSEVVVDELSSEAALNKRQIDKLLEYLNLSSGTESPETTLSKLEPLIGNSPSSLAGLEQMRELISLLDAFGLSRSQWTLDITIARGLDYYTGTVLETQLVDFPSIGSVCSGGRYNNLASLYTKQDLPGVGASIGLDRLLAALEEMKDITPRDTLTEILVTVTTTSQIEKAAATAAILRNRGIATEIYPGVSSLKSQLKYADRKKIPFALIVDLEGKSLSLKELGTGDQTNDITAEEIVSRIR